MALCNHRLKVHLYTNSARETKNEKKNRASIYLIIKGWTGEPIVRSPKFSLQRRHWTWQLLSKVQRLLAPHPAVISDNREGCLKG